MGPQSKNMGSHILLNKIQWDPIFSQTKKTKVILACTIHSDHFDTKIKTCFVHNFVNIGPFLTNLIPIESP